MSASPSDIETMTSGDPNRFSTPVNCRASSRPSAVQIIQKPTGQLPGQQQAERGADNPEADSLQRDQTDMSPLHGSAGVDYFGHTDHDGEHDDSQYVVNDRPGQNGYPFRRGHFVLFGQNARRDAD